MPNITDAMTWLKHQFAGEITTAIEGTPFTVDLITAIAMQETYSIWGNLYETLPVDEVLALCTGDTLDAPRRSAFPKTKASLIAEHNGERMFAIARQALEDVGEHIAAYREVAHKNPDKFCHGFGIFQYDLQHFAANPSFFLERRWTSFDACLALCVSGLKAALKRAYGRRRKC
jgi:hypothetical protein